MTRRLVAVVAPRVNARGGFPSARLRSAMVEDVYEKLAALELVEAVLVLRAHAAAQPDVHPPDDSDHRDDRDDLDDLAGLVWPGTPVVRVAPDATTVEVLAELARLGADEAVAVAGDAPDLPPLLVGKLHRGLGSADVAALPARGGGLVALAARCPLPGWLLAAGVDVDAADALTRLQAAAPRRHAVFVGPGWHRVRASADVSQLDASLEGWEITQHALRTDGGGGPP